MSELRSRIHTDDGQERAPSPRQVQKEGLQLKRWTVELDATMITTQHLSSFDSRRDSDGPLRRHLSSFLLFYRTMYKFQHGNLFFFKSRKAAFRFWGSCIYFAWGSVPRLGEVDHIGFYIMEGMGNTRHILGENCHSFYCFRLYHSVTTGHRGTGWDKVLLLLVYYLLMPQRREIFDSRRDPLAPCAVFKTYLVCNINMTNH